MKHPRGRLGGPSARGTQRGETPTVGSDGDVHEISAAWWGQARNLGRTYRQKLRMATRIVASERIRVNV